MATHNTLDKFKKLLLANFDTIQIKEDISSAIYRFQSLNNLTFEKKKQYETVNYLIAEMHLKSSIGAEIEDWIIQEKRIREERKEEEETLALLHSILKAYT
jgi:hypothetical protein